MINLIVDLDGTLYDNTHRRHLIPKDPTRTENWIEFNNACLDDKPIYNIIEQLRRFLLCNNDTKLTFLTSRGESARVNTSKRLQKDLNTMYTMHLTLEMRQMDDHSSPVEFKRNWLRNNYGGEPCTLFFDDNPEIIKMVQDEFPLITAVQVPSKCASVTV